jgi:HD-GYP domain-containing protein (c-di-GMP phosphodiesterase class II)
MLWGLAAIIVACVALAAFPDATPSPHATRLLAGLAAPGYIFASCRFFAVWRLLRLPSQLAMAIGSFLFAPTSMIVAAGGIWGQAAWQVELLTLCVAALPVVAFVIEHLARPGLRTITYGLPFPDAIASMRRGSARPLAVLAEKIGAYDGALIGHIDRVADLSTRLALSLGFDASATREVLLVSQLHDIGKLFVPRTILMKPARLDGREETLMRLHPALGAELIARIPEVAVAARGVGEHEEHWGGAGYPRRLQGAAISPAARIIAVADAYDALRSARAYKREAAVAEALSQIERAAGTQFEPRVVHALVRLVSGGYAPTVEARPSASDRRASAA